VGFGTGGAGPSGSVPIDAGRQRAGNVSVFQQRCQYIDSAMYNLHCSKASNSSNFSKTAEEFSFTDPVKNKINLDKKANMSRE